MLEIGFLIFLIRFQLQFSTGSWDFFYYFDSFFFFLWSYKKALFFWAFHFVLKCFIHENWFWFLSLYAESHEASLREFLCFLLLFLAWWWGKIRQQFYLILSENIWWLKATCCFFSLMPQVCWRAGDLWAGSHRKPSMNQVRKNHKVLAKMIFTIIL